MQGVDGLFERNAWLGLVNMATSEWSALDERLEEAAMELHAGNARQAYEIAVWILEREVTCVPALLIAAFASLDLGDRKNARSIVDRALGLDAADWRTHIANSWVLLAEKKRGEASKEAIFALHVAPTNPDAYTSAAQVNSMIGGKAEIAKSAAERALALDPTAVTPRLVLAQLKLYRGDWHAAEALCDEALEFAPDHELGLAMLAATQQSQGKRRQAAETFDQLAQTKPNSAHLQPDRPEEVSAGEFLGCVRSLYFGSAFVALLLVIAIAAKPVVPLLVLTLITAVATAFSPVRRWIAIRWKPREMAHATTQETWTKKNPDIVAGIAITIVFASLLGIAAVSAA